MSDSPEKRKADQAPVEAVDVASDADSAWGVSSQLPSYGDFVPYMVPPIPGTAQQPAGPAFTQPAGGDSQGREMQQPGGQSTPSADIGQPYVPPTAHPTYGGSPFGQPGAQSGASAGPGQPFIPPSYGRCYAPPTYGQGYGQNYGQPPYIPPAYQGQPYAFGPYEQPMVAKDHVAAGLLAIFLGIFGVHKFYLGYNTAGFVMLAITVLGSLFTLGLAAGVIWVISLIEGITYLVKSQSEFDAIYVARKKEWF